MLFRHKPFPHTYQYLVCPHSLYCEGFVVGVDSLNTQTNKLQKKTIKHIYQNLNYVFRNMQANGHY